MEKLGKQTIKFNTPPTILDCASIVGPKEAQGPLAKYFDQTLDDEFWGEKTWEKAESKIIKETVNTVISKSGVAANEIDCMFAGDLLNQCISSCFGLRELSIPFFGVFGACSTFVESMCLGSMAIESFANNVLCATSSHFCSAEKQFRFPLELGNQRPPTSQWTVTGSGAAILTKDGQGPYITHITPGKIVDMGIKDANNMGAAMAPAFADTLIAHFLDTGRNPSYYDMIVDKNAQDTHSGGSGCACCGTVFSGYLFKQLKERKMKKILLIATGALTNSTTSQQGETIPGIAHAISIEV